MIHSSRNKSPCLLTFLVLFAQHLSVNGKDFFCYICGVSAPTDGRWLAKPIVETQFFFSAASGLQEGFQVGDPNAVVTIPTQPDRTCQQLLDANLIGNISEFNCGLLQPFVRNNCQCQPIPPTAAPTVTPRPTLQPTSEPTILTHTPTFRPTSAVTKAVPDIVDAVIAEGSFSILLAALQAADLVDSLSEPMGPFTLFAPLDSAFENLPEGMIDAILFPENHKMLSDVLLYHVIPGRLTTSDFLNGEAIATLNGLVSEEQPQQRNVALLEIEVVGSTVTLNEDALILKPNILASNGIVHAISDILIPPDFFIEFYAMFFNDTNATLVDDFNITNTTWIDDLNATLIDDDVNATNYTLAN